MHQEDSSSYFVTPLGTPRKINFAHASPLNDLEVRRSFDDPEDTEMRPPPLMFLPRQPGVFPRGVALVIADEWGSEEAMDAACDSPNGISITNLKTLIPNPK